MPKNVALLSDVQVNACGVPFCRWRPNMLNMPKSAPALFTVQFCLCKYSLCRKPSIDVRESHSCLSPVNSTGDMLTEWLCDQWQREHCFAVAVFAFSDQLAKHADRAMFLGAAADDCVLMTACNLQVNAPPQCSLASCWPPTNTVYVQTNLWQIKTRDWLFSRYASFLSRSTALKVLRTLVVVALLWNRVLKITIPMFCTQRR